MTTIEKIKAKILDLAIRGKLVPQDPNDEPVSEFLKRIRAEKDELIKAKKIKKEKNPSEIVIGSDGKPYEKFADGKIVSIDDEIPFGLPQGWAWARLGELFILGSAKRVLKDDWQDAGVPFYRTREIIKLAEAGTVDNELYISEALYDQLRTYGLPKQNDLMVTAIGSIGIAYVVKQNDRFYYKDASVLCFENRWNLCAWFFKDLLASPYMTKLVHDKSAGTTVASITIENANRYLIPLPPLAEQKRIVAKIEELFGEVEKIATAKDGITRTAERINKKVLDFAIRGQLVPQDASDEPAAELLKRITEARQKATMGRSRAAGKNADSVIFRGADRSAYETRNGKTVCIDDEIPFDIPDSWAWARFGGLVNIIAGVSYQKDDVTTTGVRILRGGNIKEDAHIYLNDDDVFLPQQYADSTTAVNKGDVVIVASTGSSTVIGRPAIASEDMPSVQIGAFLRILRARDESFRAWLPVIVLGDYYRKHIREQSKGTNIKNLKAEYLNEMLIPIPPLAEQKRIVAKIEEVRKLTQSLTK